MSPNITIKDLDFWLFTGFDGLINLFQKRSINTQSSLDLNKFKDYVRELDEVTTQIETFPEQELNSDEVNTALLNCLFMQLQILNYRLKYCHRTQNKETTSLLRNNISKLKGLIAGYEVADYRAQNPYEQGEKDAKGGWPNRGSKLFPHAQQVAEYERGYSTIKRI